MSFENNGKNMVKLKVFNDETWIRECAYCKSDKEICNVCTYRPKDILKHKHKFYYIKTLIKRNWLKSLFNSEYKTKMFKCPCGKIEMKGHQIIKLPSDWEWDYY